MGVMAHTPAEPTEIIGSSGEQTEVIDAPPANAGPRGGVLATVARAPFRLRFRAAVADPRRLLGARDADHPFAGGDTARPVELRVHLPRRPSPAIEAIAYFSVAELLTNVVKHARATEVTATVSPESPRSLAIAVRDNGIGGAHPSGADAAGGSGLAGLLTERGHEVVAVVGDALSLREVVGAQRPDVAVVDVRMPPTFTDEELLAAIELRRAYPRVGVLVFSQWIETRYATELLAAGAGGVGYLLEDRVADVDLPPSDTRHRRVLAVLRLRG